MLSPTMVRLIQEQRLGFVATVNGDGTPNLSPKGTFVVIDPSTVAFAEIRSPMTLENLATRPSVEINFVDCLHAPGLPAFWRSRNRPARRRALQQLVAAFCHI